MCLCAGQSLTSVKTKAGEALRLHKTSVGEEAREEEEAVEEQKTDGGEGGDPELSVSAESPVSAAAPGRGVFSSITHAMQNTVSEHTHTQSCKQLPASDFWFKSAKLKNTLVNAS